MTTIRLFALAVLAMLAGVMCVGIGAIDAAIACFVIGIALSCGVFATQQYEMQRLAQLEADLRAARGSLRESRLEIHKLKGTNVGGVIVGGQQYRRAWMDAFIPHATH